MKKFIVLLLTLISTYAYAYYDDDYTNRQTVALESIAESAQSQAIAQSHAESRERVNEILWGDHD